MTGVTYRYRKGKKKKNRAEEEKLLSAVTLEAQPQGMGRIHYKDLKQNSCTHSIR